MASGARTTTRRQRILSVFLVGMVFLLLQVGSGVFVSMQSLAHNAPMFWVLYACYGLSALLFYGIGSFCWLYAYAKQHTVATLLFFFTSCMMVAFSSLSASAVGNDVFTALSNGSIAFAILFLFFLLLYFPYAISNRLSRGAQKLLYVSRISITALCAFTLFRDIYVYLFHYAAPNWWILASIVYYLLTALAIIVVIVYTTRSITTLREQQQSRFFFLGTLLSFVPILGVTVLPTLFHSHFVVNGTLSVIALILFPISAGYAILRYNLLVFDSYVRKIVVSVVSAMGLALLTFTLFAIGSVFVSSAISIYLASLLTAGVIGGPCIWWFGGCLTERAFFPETQYYKRMLKQVQQNRMEQSFDLQNVAHLLVIDIMTTLNAPGACVFVLDEKTHAFALLPSPVHEAARTERVRTLILEQVAACLSSSAQEGKQIDGDNALIQKLQATKRPLFWSEVVKTREERVPDRTTRYSPFVSQQEEHTGPLFAPLRSPQGEVIGIAIINERGDEQCYAGPELEALVQLLHLSALSIEPARQFHIAMFQQEQTAREVEAAYQQQRQLSEMKDQLIIHMSHELRTPLAEVSGFLELIRDSGEELDPALRAIFVEKAIHGSDELLSLLSSILNAAHLGTPQDAPLLENVEMLTLVQEEVDHLDPHLSQLHQVRLQGTQEVHVQASIQEVRQIVRNLLSNALKYSPDHATVTVHMTAQNGKGILRVKDEGPGITAQEMPLLFLKFSRLPRHHSGSIRGTGLGLFISRQMAESMQGHLWAESSGVEGEGSSFFLTLPLVGTSQQTQPYALIA